MVNLSAFTNTTENVAVGAVQAINSESGYVFGFMLLLAVYLIILFPSMNRFGMKAAFSASAFIGGIVAVLLRILSIINDTVLIGAIVLVAIAIAILYLARD